MDYKQKYNEALERARKIENGELINILDGTSIPVAIFPELKESKDEKIRKQIISFLKEFEHDHYRSLDFSSWISWLEKQGEQKPTDKVEPKFKVGDCVAENEPNNYARFIQILEIVNVQGKERYRISRDTHNDEDVVEFGFVEKYYHKFNIQDLKDGDVLHLGCVTAIFKKYIDQEKCICYCSFCDNGGFEIPIENGEDNVYGCTNTTPATQEQRDLLFQKMKEAGYKWNAKKKELIKL